jgi:ribosome-binding protein aMBF1 (putative translation factor)
MPLHGTENIGPAARKLSWEGDVTPMRKSVRQQIKIIEAIISAREAAQISQMQLSSKLGGSSTLMQKIESGDRDVKVSEFISIANALGVDPCELLRKAVAK